MMPCRIAMAGLKGGKSLAPCGLRLIRGPMPPTPKPLPQHFLSESLGRIKPSPTIAATQKARDLIAAGRDVISLGVGEPDFDTPDNIKEAAIAAIRRGETKYTAVEGIRSCARRSRSSSSAENGLDYSVPPDLRGAGRQGHRLQRADGDAEPRRRGHRAGALLGELSRHRPAGGRQAGDARDASGRRLQAARGGSGGRDHAGRRNG